VFGPDSEWERIAWPISLSLLSILAHCRLGMRACGTALADRRDAARAPRGHLIVKTRPLLGTAANTRGSPTEGWSVGRFPGQGVRGSSRPGPVYRASRLCAAGRRCARHRLRAAAGRCGRGLAGRPVQEEQTASCLQHKQAQPGNRSKQAASRSSARRAHPPPPPCPGPITQTPFATLPPPPRSGAAHAGGEWLNRMRQWSIVWSVGPLYGSGRQRPHACAGQPGRPAG
jgi:hypothetical protein